MSYTTTAIQILRNKFYELKWYEVYDFIEFCLAEFSFDKKFIDELNEILDEENVPYRIIENLVTPLISKEEVEEINCALSIQDRYQPVKKHIKKSLKHYSTRPKADYQNSIKESVSALEALARVVTGKQNNTFGQLCDELLIHPALRDGLKKIYGWTCDENGVRHSEKNYPSLSADEEEARLMLVLSSAFVNYIISKNDKYAI
ncbi:MAG TPA: hypothetical protein PKK61_12475 [Defluviitaleaceae bacterium]|nr:hypothetical protein [Defluviitaleaceae bacterium]